MNAVRVGYCTNVHAGTDLASMRQSLADHAVQIARQRRQAGSSDRPLPVGLWIAASAAGELIAGDGAERFADWLGEHDLELLTINGFPYDNFHLPVVKHRVYRPGWWNPLRRLYTLQLAEIQDRMLTRWESSGGGGDQKAVGTISTLPIGWPGRLGWDQAEGGGGGGPASGELDDQQRLAQAGRELRQLAAELAELERRSGRRIIVAIEPEPGCLFDRYQPLLDYFDRELPDPNHRRHIGVCHDVCHSAVMFESQAEALAAYAAAGVVVGKIQVSSAIDVPLGRMDDQQRRAAIAQLTQFAEDRYLHQSGTLDADGRFQLWEDLPQWLDSLTLRQAAGAAGRDQHLRIHFHVPIYRDQLGALSTTAAEIQQAVVAAQSTAGLEFTRQFEVETYAWTVLPETVTSGKLAAADLAAGIGRELDWFESLVRHL